MATRVPSFIFISRHSFNGLRELKKSNGTTEQQRPGQEGKTSLSFALAGLFSLSIYYVSIGELTESGLATLSTGFLKDALF
jgi:hypothetical protein